MVEQSSASQSHHHAIFITRLNHHIITDGATGLRDVAYAALLGAVDAVTEGEECIRAKRHTR